MLRSAIVILLSIVCGSAAAIGVYQVVSRRAEQATEVEPITTRTVLIANSAVSRGDRITAASVGSVEWPEEFAPAGALSNPEQAIGTVALSSIVAGEPLFPNKLARPGEGGFVASLIEKGMRAYTIQATSQSSSVAGFVRPGDYVDVLLALKGNAADPSGGGSTITLLQVVKVLAIDQILDAEADVLAMWTKGDTLKSVTLLVTPEQASLLSVGQQNGELSLALRSGDDLEPSLTASATIRQIQQMQQEVETLKTVPVLVAADVVRRGQTVTQEMLQSLDWPEDLIPAGTFSDPADVIGRVAVTSVLPQEPLFESKLAPLGGSGFAASLVQDGMRGYTIQTSGPAASVAGLVRPGDRVDVLLTLQEDPSIEKDGGSTAPLLQSVEVLAVDQFFDPDKHSATSVDASQPITSVTLMVTPQQASTLSLAQHSGELSLSLRSLEDTSLAAVEPATLEQIRKRHSNRTVATRPADEAPAGGADQIPLQPGPPPPSIIQTLRGSSIGRVMIHERSQ